MYDRDFYRFGPFRLYVPALALFCNGQPIELTPKALGTLLALVKNQGRVVSKDELLQEVWEGVFVEDGVIARNIHELRKALSNGDAAEYIETAPKRGYRFVPEVQLQREAAPVRSLAVLPFRPIGLPPQQAYLGVGIADAVIIRLAMLRELTVRPMSAVARYATTHADAVTAGKELAVAAVLEGSLQRFRKRVRLTLQLVGVADGAPLWSAKLDQDAADLFALEDSVAEKVADALSLQLSGKEREQVRRRYTENLQAYQFYLKARALLTTRGFDRMDDAIACYRRAIKHDPQFSPAYAGLAYCYGALVVTGPARPADVIPQAKAAAAQALALTPELPEARAALAFTRWHYDYEWQDTERHLRALIEVSPRDPLGHHLYSMLLAELGRFEEALREINYALELDPNAAVLHGSAGLVFYLARRYEEAIAACRAALRLDDHCFRACWVLGMAHEQRGKLNYAVQQFRRLASISNDNSMAVAALAHTYALSGEVARARAVLEQLRKSLSYVSASELAIVYGGLGELDRAFTLLEQAVEERSAYLVLLKVEPRFDSLRSDPRFARILARIGLSDHSAAASA